MTAQAKMLLGFGIGFVFLVVAVRYFQKKHFYHFFICQVVIIVWYLRKKGKIGDLIIVLYF